MTAVATAAVPADLLPVAHTRTSIGREPVHDRAGAVVAYDLRFGVRGVLDPDEHDTRLAQLVHDAFGAFPLERLGSGRRYLVVNLPYAMAVGALPVPFGPQAVAVHLLGEYEVDDAVLAGVLALAEQGFRVVVDATVSGPACEELLPHVDVLRVAVPRPTDELGDLAAYVRSIAPKAQLLAEQVPDHATYDACAAAGFDLFQGYVPAPAGTPARQPAAAGPSAVVCLQLLASLADPTSTATDHERIVAADPALSLRILAAVNSASGAGRHVGSLKQALVLLGRPSLSAWVTLAAFGGRATSREQLVDVLTRARTCEALAPTVTNLDGPLAYAAGLLSGVVDVLGVSPDAIARDAHLGPEMVDVLVRRAGPVGLLVATVEQFDRTGRSTGSQSREQLDQARLLALGSALETVDAVLGDA